MILTPHFTLEELTHSLVAGRKNIDNTPSDRVIGNLLELAKGLERVRNILAVPMSVSSGFRCIELNRAIGSHDTSAHIEGWAADFIAPLFGKPIDIVRAIESSAIGFDQCIQEGTWVHISFDPRNRREVLTAHFDAAGTATYTKGV